MSKNKFIVNRNLLSTKKLIGFIFMKKRERSKTCQTRDGVYIKEF